jgi:hypothetical protein
MFVRWIYRMRTQGSATAAVLMTLDPGRRYLITGALVGKAGGDYGQVFISTLCIRHSPDQILCGIRDDPEDPPEANIADLPNIRITEFVQNATRVTVKLRGDGGLHRAEGVIYDIT